MAKLIDARVERTRRQLREAISAMLREAPAGPLSISELCTRAGISRPTFYQHFKTPDEAVAFMVRERLALLARVPRSGGVAAVVERLVEAIVADRDLYRPILGPDAGYGAARRMVEKWLGDRLRATVRPADDAATRRARFAAGGVLVLVADWLAPKAPPTPEEATRLIITITELVDSVLTPG